MMKESIKTLLKGGNPHFFKEGTYQKITPIYHAQDIDKKWSWLKGAGVLPKRFRVPKNLIVVTVDNRKKSFVQKQFEHYGCGLAALKPKIKPWSNTLRLRPYLEYLKSNVTKGKEYVIFCDSDDVLFSESPDKILCSFVNEFDCDLLFNSTPFWIGYDQFNWMSISNNQKARQTHPDQYLNAGLYIGRKDFIIEVYEDVLSYVTDDDPAAKKYYYNPTKYRANFPKGCGSDQVILRHLEFKYYPKLQIDTEYKLLRRR